MDEISKREDSLARKFYQIYSEGKIANTVYEIQENADIHFTLSWSHYLILMRIANQNERNFYEIECYKQNWSVRQLQRQYNSSLYERLALSRNKDEVIYASAYQLYLPDKALLQAKVKEWIAEFEENEELMKHEGNE